MGLMLSVLVMCVGVVEALSCLQHIRDSYLPCEFKRRKRRMVVDLSTGTVRHADISWPSDVPRNSHVIKKRSGLSSPHSSFDLPDDDEPIRRCSQHFDSAQLERAVSAILLEEDPSKDVSEEPSLGSVIESRVEFPTQNFSPRRCDENFTFGPEDALVHINEPGQTTETLPEKERLAPKRDEADIVDLKLSEARINDRPPQTISIARNESLTLSEKIPDERGSNSDISFGQKYGPQNAATDIPPLSAMSSPDATDVSTDPAEINRAQDSKQSLVSDVKLLDPSKIKHDESGTEDDTKNDLRKSQIDDKFPRCHEDAAEELSVKDAENATIGVTTDRGKQHSDNTIVELIESTNDLVFAAQENVEECGLMPGTIKNQESIEELIKSANNFVLTQSAELVQLEPLGKEVSSTETEPCFTDPRSHSEAKDEEERRHSDSSSSVQLYSEEIKLPETEEGPDDLETKITNDAGISGLATVTSGHASEEITNRQFSLSKDSDEDHVKPELTIGSEKAAIPYQVDPKVLVLSQIAKESVTSASKESLEEQLPMKSEEEEQNLLDLPQAQEEGSAVDGVSSGIIDNPTKESIPLDGVESLEGRSTNSPHTISVVVRQKDLPGQEISEPVESHVDDCLLAHSPVEDQKVNQLEENTSTGDERMSTVVESVTLETSDPIGDKARICEEAESSDMVPPDLNTGDLAKDRTADVLGMSQSAIDFQGVPIDAPEEPTIDLPVGSHTPQAKYESQDMRFSELGNNASEGLVETTARPSTPDPIPEEDARLGDGDKSVCGAIAPEMIEAEAKTTLKTQEAPISEPETEVSRHREAGLVETGEVTSSPDVKVLMTLEAVKSSQSETLVQVEPELTLKSAGVSLNRDGLIEPSEHCKLDSEQSAIEESTMEEPQPQELSRERVGDVPVDHEPLTVTGELQNTGLHTVQVEADQNILAQTATKSVTTKAAKAVQSSGAETLDRPELCPPEHTTEEQEKYSVKQAPDSSTIDVSSPSETKKDSTVEPVSVVNDNDLEQPDTIEEKPSVPVVVKPKSFEGEGQYDPNSNEPKSASSEPGSEVKQETRQVESLPSSEVVDLTPASQPTQNFENVDDSPSSPNKAFWVRD